MNTARIKHIKRLDRLVTWLVNAGGVGVIVCVLGMLVLITAVAAPLFFSAQLRLLAKIPTPPTFLPNEVLALGVGEYRQLGFNLNRNGKLHFFTLLSGESSAVYNLRPNQTGYVHLQQVSYLGQGRYSLFWNNAATSLVQINVRPQFDAQQQRTILPDWQLLSHRAPPAANDAPLQAVLHAHETGDTRLNLLPDGRLLLERWRQQESLFASEENIRHILLLESGLPAQELAYLAVSADGQHAYAASHQGLLLYWYIEASETKGSFSPNSHHSLPLPITALSLLLGDQTLLAGHADGTVSSWLSSIDIENESLILQQVRSWSAHQAPIQQLISASRSKSLLSLAANGSLSFSHNTSGRRLIHLPIQPPLQMAALDVRDQTVLSMNAEGGLSLWSLEAPYPEGGWRAFFGKIRYEGYQEPQYLWQSSAATDDAEPKLSFIPLVFGTLKATFYGMLFAAPLGVISALYASQLMESRLRNIIKPMFELMDAVPTVILGFLAAFWLAPLVEARLSGMLITLGLLPPFILVLLQLLTKLDNRLGWLNRLRGREFLLVIPTVTCAALLAFQLGNLLDKLLLGAPFSQWLSQNLGVHYDQRNAIIIAIALGFAVVPSVFSISEDALSNVPRRLTAASLALGASRWQTLWRVVLPSASPGIFAALMLGLGRAVGETMIVLMAAGNTPILDASIFTGMRTLSANIAVEIPEAPQGSTLYRTLFLSAVMLFAATFVINSVAEIVRSRLRQRFGNY